MSHLNRVYNESRTHVETKVGEAFSIRLKGDASTGFLWSLLTKSDNVYIVETIYQCDADLDNLDDLYDLSDEKSSLEMIPGKDYTTFVLMPVREGCFVVRAEYRRPFDPNSHIESIEFFIVCSA